MIVKKVYRLLISSRIREFINILRFAYRQKNEDKKLLNYLFQLPSGLLLNTHLLSDRTELLNCMPKNAVVGEIGVDNGEFSEKILKLCNPIKLHLIDPWASEIYGEEKYLLVKENIYNQNENVEINRGFSFDILKNFANKYFDWVYLDAAHDYESVRRDLQLLKPLIKDNGIIAGHDYKQWSISSGIERFGVIEAVNQFCIENNWELLYLTNEPHRYLSYAITKLK